MPNKPGYFVIDDGRKEAEPAFKFWENAEKMADAFAFEKAQKSREATFKTNAEILDILNSDYDQAVYFPESGSLFLSFGGREDPMVSEGPIARDELLEQVAGFLASVQGDGEDHHEETFYDDAIDLGKVVSEYKQGSPELANRVLNGMPDQAKLMEQSTGGLAVVRDSVVGCVEEMLDGYNGDHGELWSRVAEKLGFDAEQSETVGKLLESYWTPEQLRNPKDGIYAILPEQMEALNEITEGDPDIGSRVMTFELGGLMQGRYMCVPEADEEKPVMILDNRDGVFDTEAFKTQDAAILYLTALGDSTDGMIDEPDVFFELDELLVEHPELEAVGGKWYNACYSAAEHTFESMSKDMDFRDIWKGDAAQVANPLAVISQLQDMSQGDWAAVSITAATMAFAEYAGEVEVTASNLEKLAHAVAEKRADPYTGVRGGDDIVAEFKETMREEAAWMISGEGRGISELAAEKAAEARSCQEHGGYEGHEGHSGR